MRQVSFEQGLRHVRQELDRNVGRHRVTDRAQQGREVEQHRARFHLVD
jgi:hypothetical protein